MNIKRNWLIATFLFAQAIMLNMPGMLAAEVSHWTFNDGSGTSVIDSVGGSNGTVNGGATWTMGALKFDGANDYVDCGNNSILNITSAITIEAWINLSSATGRQPILRKSSSDYYQYGLFVYNGKLQSWLKLSNGAKIITGSTPLAINTWHHVFMTYDGSTIKLYVNGTLDASLSGAGTINADTRALTIGMGDAYSSYFCGLIDEVRLYDTALTAAEIAAKVYPWSQWSFHYWGMDTNLVYVTAGMVNTAGDITYWRNRGVMAQYWKGGRCNYAQYNTVPTMTTYWTASYPQWTGILIDEFGGTGNSIDQFLGDCVGASKTSQSNMYIAAYCIGIFGQQMIAGLKKADKILVETYVPSSRSNYSTITSRYQLAINNSLSNTSLVALGIDSDWITTPTELRRQLHFVRYTFPNMAGIAFFNSGTSYTTNLMPYINNLLGHFYINPVLRMEPLAEGTVKVWNIGGSDSSATTVKIVISGQEYTRDVPALASGASCIVQGGTNPQPVTEYTNGCFKLGPPMLYNNEPAAYRPNATAAWPQEGALDWELNENFTANPVDSYEYDGSYIKAAYCSMNNSTATRNCEMRFDLSLDQIQYYGAIEIGLSSSADSAIRLKVYRGDGEPSPRITVYITDDSGMVTSEEVAVNLAAASYKVKIRYSTDGYVRVALLNNSGVALWDTGEIPVYNTVSFDHIRFGVRTSSSSALEWDAVGQRMRLRGAASISYILNAYVDNLEVDCWQ